MINNINTFLNKRFLIASPVLSDSNFAKSIIYLCRHDENGAMGFVINTPFMDLGVTNLFNMLNIKPSKQANSLSIHLGGPVDVQKGFVLHSNDYPGNSFTDEENKLALSMDLAILEDIASGRGPNKSLFILGHSFWGAGQLEAEIIKNYWIPVNANSDFVFNGTPAQKWNLAFEDLGLNQFLFSPNAGNA